MGQDVDTLRNDIERRREDLGETLDAIGDRISPGRMMARRRNRMSESMRSLKERVMGTVSSGTESATGAMSTIKDSVGPDAVRQQTEGSPLAAGVVAFGLGFITAAIFPPSDAEAQAAAAIKEKAEPLTGELAAAGREVADDLKEHAAEAAQDLKESATRAAADVKQTASAEASALGDEASRAGDQISQVRST